MTRKQKEFDTEQRRFVAPRGKNQQRIVDSILFNPITILNGPAGSGKSNPDYTFVLSRDNGFVRIDSLEIGDYIIGQDGQPTKVLRIFPNDNLDIYEITFSDGTTTRCCREHLWAVKPLGSSAYTNLTLEEIISEFTTNPNLQLEIPICDAINFPEQKELDIHPYLLAYFITKGIINNSGFIELTLTESEFLKLIEVCPKLPYVEKNKVYYCHTYMFDHTLVRLGLNGIDSSSKFIPDQYLYSSIEHRIQLLNGLLDANNYDDFPYVYHFGIEFLDGIKFLVQSLGGLSTLSINLKTGFHSTTIELPISIKACLDNIYLPTDFAEKYIKLEELHKYIVSTKFIGQEPGRCLLVDNSNHLFLLNDCIVTHNTLLSVQTLYGLMKSGQLDQILIIRLITETFNEKIGALPGPQPLDSKVLTPTGWKLMKDLIIGDEVIAIDGSPAKVLGIYPKGIKDIYSIKTIENKETKACIDHLWATKTLEQQKRNKDYSIKNTQEIIESLYNNENKLNHLLPRNKSVEFQYNQTLPIPPYTLGAFLGDGCISNNVSIINPESEILERINLELNSIECKLGKHTDIQYNICSNEKLFNNKPAKSICIKNLEDDSITMYSSIGIALQNLSINRSTLHHRCTNNVIIDNLQYSFIEDAPKWTNKFKESLNQLGLDQVKATTKFIPNIYKYTSISDRISLLQGLMDTDGSIKANGEASFCTTSIQLANDIIELVRSLGGRAVLKERDRRGDRHSSNSLIIETKHICYEFNISLPKEINPFYVSRKAQYHKCKLIHSDRIKSIDYIDQQECQCILIDHPTHLYITDDYIITHNTAEEKLDPFMGPIKDNLAQFLPPGEIEYLLKNNKIEVLPVSFCRGRSLANKGVIVEEAQNLTPDMINTIATRIGPGSKLVFNGDPSQVDFWSRNGIEYLTDLFLYIDETCTVTLDTGDIQRHPLISKIIKRAEALRSKYSHQN